MSELTLDRGIGYDPAINGHNFSLCDQTKAAPATYLAQTSYAATTPFLLLCKAAGLRRYIIRRLEFSQTGTVAAGAIGVRVLRDLANRYSSGGTAIVAANTHRKFDGVSMVDLLVYANATASAQTDGNIKWIKDYDVVATVGNTITIDFEDGLILDESAGSILVYIYAATTPPTLKINGDIIEE